MKWKDMDKKQRKYFLWYFVESIIYILIVSIAVTMLLIDAMSDFFFPHNELFDAKFIMIMFGAMLYAVIMLKLGLIQKKIDGVIY